MKRLFFFAVMLFFCGFLLSAQPDALRWSLNNCLNYALDHNLQIRQKQTLYQSGLEQTEQAKQSLLPTLSASINQNFTNYPSSDVSTQNVYSGNYGVHANWTLFQGGRLLNGVKQSKLQNSIDALSIDESQKGVQMSVVQAYIQCLYAQESIALNQRRVEVSQAQCERGAALYKTGVISKVDYAQLESQLASDEYLVVAAENNYATYLLQLKQLLELDLDQTIEVVVPEISAEDVLLPIDSKESIYRTALQVMPQIEGGKLNIESAKLNEKIAKSGYYPTVSLGVNAGTAHSSAMNIIESNQVWNNFNENVGLSISVPIYSNRKNLTAKNQAKLATYNSELELQNSEKQLLSAVEELYLGVVTNQAQYGSASKKLSSTQQTFDLVSEQFRVGVKNTLELLTAQNDLFVSQGELLQAKYMVVMSRELLHIYQGIKINELY